MESWRLLRYLWLFYWHYFSLDDVSTVNAVIIRSKYKNKNKRIQSLKIDAKKPIISQKERFASLIKTQKNQSLTKNQNLEQDVDRTRQKRILTRTVYHWTVRRRDFILFLSKKGGNQTSYSRVELSIEKTKTCFEWWHCRWWPSDLVTQTGSDSMTRERRIEAWTRWLVNVVS